MEQPGQIVKVHRTLEDGSHFVTITKSGCGTRRIKMLPTSVEHPSLFVTCTKCKARQFIASGHVVSGINREKLNEILAVIGWQASPKMKCQSCLGK